MEGVRIMKAAVVVVVMMVVVVTGQDSGGTGQDSGGTNSTSPFITPPVDCYVKCLFFCVIEPQNVCTCTSTCLKQCFNTPSSSMAMAMVMNEHEQNLDYCKLGCATSSCSNISNPHNPDGESMETCVDSCSSKCSLSYH